MSFDEFVTAELPGLLRYAAALTGSPDAAADLVQEVMVRAHGRWSRIAVTEHPERYVCRMVTNEFLSWRRRWATRHVVLDQMPDRSTGTDHAAESAERDEAWARLARLPRRQRAVLVLRYYEGLTDAEIADVLGCTAGTVRGHACRALAALRVQLGSAVSPKSGERS